MRCRERSGFLFAHKCEHPVESNCSQCSKPICRHHRRLWQQQQVCITCFKQQQQQAPDGTRQRLGDQHYYSYYDDPFWYAGYHYHSYPYYDAQDHAAFDRDGAESGLAGAESDWEAS